jgi:hypothetical protein
MVTVNYPITSAGTLTILPKSSFSFIRKLETDKL